MEKFFLVGGLVSLLSCPLVSVLIGLLGLSNHFAPSHLCLFVFPSKPFDDIHKQGNTNSFA